MSHVGILPDWIHLPAHATSLDECRVHTNLKTFSQTTAYTALTASRHHAVVLAAAAFEAGQRTCGSPSEEGTARITAHTSKMIMSRSWVATYWTHCCQRYRFPTLLLTTLVSGHIFIIIVIKCATFCHIVNVSIFLTFRY